MKFALVNDLKTQATKGVRGTCLNCGSPMIANCGPIKIHHWAHKNIRNCDQWWENETAWHRQWKNKFPKDWQEISLLDDKTGEKYIADVRTEHDLVLEFQHSFIKSEERISRENFYKNMVWVVDGCRSDLDKSYFQMGLSGPIQKSPLAYQITWLGKSRILNNWRESEAIVFLDFGEDMLWRLVSFDNQKKIGSISNSS